MSAGRLARVAGAALVLAVFCLAMAGGRPVRAHASLESSAPAADSVVTDPPAEVVLRFAEPVEARLTEVRVLDVFGDRVDTGETRVTSASVVVVGVGPLGDGTYTVSWRNVSAVDGHPALGSFIFSVGFPTITSPPAAEQPPMLASTAEPWVRWGALLGVLGLAGGLLLRLVFDVTAAQAASGGDPPAGAEAAGLRAKGVLAVARRRSDVALWTVLGLAVAGTIAHGAVAAASIYRIGLGGVVSADVFRLVQDTFWGRVWLARLALLLAVAVPLAVLTRPRTAPPGAPGRSGRASVAARLRSTLPWSAALLLSAGAVTTLSVVSHGSATAGIGGIAFTSDLIHASAAAVWIGGLLQLAVLLPGLAATASDGGGGPRLLSTLIPRFSLLAGLSAGVLLVTGLFSGYAQVTTLDAARTPHGYALIAKVLVIAPLVAVAAVNLLWLRPRIRSQAASRRLLARTVFAEVALAVLVLAGVGFLTALEPARQSRSRELASAPGLDFEDRADGARIRASLQPGVVGDNSLVVNLADRGGRPIENATLVNGRMRYLGDEFGEPMQAGLDHGGGAWVVHGVPVSVAGSWQLEVLVQRPDAFDANLAWRLEIGTSRAQRGTLVPEPGTARMLFGAQIAIIGLLFAGVAVAVGGWGSQTGRVLSIAGGSAVLVGALFITGSGGPGGGGPGGNPIPANQASVDAGRALYIANCQACHGESGAGNGPLRAGLPTAPANLVIHVPLHRDGELFRFIRDGLNTMPAWGDQLSDDEIWHLVNYVRTLAAGATSPAETRAPGAGRSGQGRATPG